LSSASPNPRLTAERAETAGEKLFFVFRSFRGGSGAALLGGLSDLCG
jgi:hypothetical protein